MSQKVRQLIATSYRYDYSLLIIIIILNTLIKCYLAPLGEISAACTDKINEHKA